MSVQGQKLFDLLPALYRQKDTKFAQSQQLLTLEELTILQALQALAPPLSSDQQAQLDQLTAKSSRGPLQSLLTLVEEQLGVLAEDLDQFYDDQFIETCAPWVIPYIGDLIGYQPVHGVAPAVASPRAEVAQTISLRRRKGTVLVLEQLARDVSGWGAHAIEFFKVLAVTQYMNDVRLENQFAPDLRCWQAGEYMDTGFDATAHKIDVRRITVGQGRYNIQNVGIFLWSLNAYSLTKVTTTPVTVTTLLGKSGPCFRFSPLGADMPLFTNPVSQGSDITMPAGPVNVPDVLRARVLCQDIQSGIGAVYYGEGKSLALFINGTLLNPYQIQVCDLSGDDGKWANAPLAGSTCAAAVDPELGRIALPPLSTGSATPQVQASFCYGFNAEMGGGEYSRAESFIVQDPAWVFPFPDSAGAHGYKSLQDALNFATSTLLSEKGQVAAVEITNSDVYQINSAASPGLQINVPEGTTIELRAADRCRPTVVLGGEMAVIGGVGSAFELNGLLLTYAAPTAGSPIPNALVHIPNQAGSQLGQLGVNHCTLVPGLALAPQGGAQFGDHSALVAELSGLKVVIQKSILGGVLVHESATASLSDSILDACDPTGVAYAGLDGNTGGGSLTLRSCTVIGKIHATLLAMITNSIVWAGLAKGSASIWTTPLLADRKQQGCVRFSYLPAGSVTPREFECVEQGTGVSTPVFYSMRYGDAGYAKLSPSTGNSIRRGAEDGGEMGAFHFLLAPFRETDLLVRLQEYLPVGLEFGIFYEN